jgi:hypothetical protein
MAALFQNALSNNDKHFHNPHPVTALLLQGSKKPTCLTPLKLRVSCRKSKLFPIYSFPATVEETEKLPFSGAFLLLIFGMEIGM